MPSVSTQIGPSLDLVADRLVILAQFPHQSLEEQDQVLTTLKEHADRLMRSNIQQCLEVADLMCALGETNGAPQHQALGLLARANANTVVLGNFREGLEEYDRAIALYSSNNFHIEAARSQIGRIYALASLGRYDEAFIAGERASSVLAENGEFFHLARLNVNLAVVYDRRGQPERALTLLDQARVAYRQLGIEGEPHWLRVEVNRAVVLRNLGRFQESIETSQDVITSFTRLGQPVSAARARQALAITFFLIGRYNEALSLLDQAREVLIQDGRQRQAMIVELFISDCLLQLRRFEDVLEKCRQVRQLFSELGADYEVAQSMLSESSALAGLGRHAEAIETLAKARHLFKNQGNRAGTAEADLQVAEINFFQGEVASSQVLALQSREIFRSLELPLWQARADLIIGRAALARGELTEAQYCLQTVVTIGERHNVPTLVFAGNHLLGKLALAAGDPSSGLVAFEKAMAELERLCGRLMTEFRASFIADKESLYEDAVGLCLDLDRPEQGLEYAERAKSRALLDLLAHRIDLSLTAHTQADIPLIAELTRLQEERNYLYRRLAGDENRNQRGAEAPLNAATGSDEVRLAALEKQITDLWHKLLIRNTSYARQASLWQVRTEPVRPYLADDTLLLEYYITHQQVVVFIVDRHQVRAIQLPGKLTQIQRLLQLLWMNLRAVPHAHPAQVNALVENAQGILHRLYANLVEPIMELLRDFSRLIVVPHGPLHYLPFHALYNGQRYLLENFELSYLPGASFLRYSSENQPQGRELVAFGNSYGQKLPFALTEAQEVAVLANGKAFLEEQATLDALRQVAPDCRVLHLATHGDFRPDNPLFSGLALADGWLTTLEIFNLHLDASLVTLSACQTGRSVVGGGDELLGLMRAFIAAGAASLVSTHWAVEDRTTGELMRQFYTRLSEGLSKGAALRQAQLATLYTRASDSPLQHPYYWAPFFLVGAYGPL